MEFGKGGSAKAPMLKRITDLQIVNGGQTTASIAELAKDGVDISKVRVPMKINVVLDEEHYKETVKAISTCANSQTPIKESDFESGDDMLKELEKISRSEIAPKTGKKWYFERMRGQYANERNLSAGYDRKVFEEDNPKENVMTKTDIAKVVMLWECKPQIGCNSREACFEAYMRMLRKEETKIDTSYFHYIVALMILYKRIDETSRSMCKSGDFVSRVTAYAMSAIAELSEHRLNLDYVWNAQMLQPELEAHIQRAVGLAQRHLMQNPTRSWARIVACWNDMKEGLEGIFHAPQRRLGVSSALFLSCLFLLTADACSFSASQSSLFALNDIDCMKFQRLFNVTVAIVCPPCYFISFCKVTFLFQPYNYIFLNFPQHSNIYC